MSIFGMILVVVLSVIAFIVIWPPKAMRVFWANWAEHQRQQQEKRKKVLWDCGYAYAKDQLARGVSSEELELTTEESKAYGDFNAFDEGIRAALFDEPGQ